MQCTIISHQGKDELMFGRQEFTGIENPQFYDVPEAFIEEIRTCPTEAIQAVLSKIQQQCAILTI